MTRRLRARSDDGFAMVTVLLSMTVATLILLATLSTVARSAVPSRADADAKAALAAAQAGIDEFLSRQNSDPEYYTNNGIDATNPAFGAGVAIAGTGGAAASFSYRLLTDKVTTGLSGVIRLKVTGRSCRTGPALSCPAGQAQTRDLIATLRPDGFLRYIYFTDLEVKNPVFYENHPMVRRNGAYSVVDPLDGPNGTKDYLVTWTAPPATVRAVCGSYYYAGRKGAVATPALTYLERRQPRKADGSFNGTPTETLRTVGADKIEISTQRDTNGVPLVGCPEIAFGGNDVIQGPLHTNDAMQITGPAHFAAAAETSWGPGQQLPQPADGRLWWQPEPPASFTLPGSSPQHVSLVQMPNGNDELRKFANPTAPDNGPGCLYSGHTRIRFAGNTMWVLSPGTRSGTVSRCYNTGTPNTEQPITPIPPVVYVQQAASCGTVGIDYPKPNEDTNRVHSPKYNCASGNAFVSGNLSGRTTIGAAQDIVVVGNTTYAGGLTGADALGLIPNGQVWVYHPIGGPGAPVPGDNLLPASQAVRQVDAAILSVGNSFIVQNYDLGTALSTSDPATKLTVRGSIGQKYRGPVGTAGNSTVSPPVAPTGYTKNYVYDERLRNAPPPFFLRPVSTPWKVRQVTD